MEKGAVCRKRKKESTEKGKGSLYAGKTVCISRNADYYSSEGVEIPCNKKMIKGVYRRGRAAGLHAIMMLGHGPHLHDGVGGQDLLFHVRLAGRAADRSKVTHGVFR